MSIASNATEIVGSFFKRKPEGLASPHLTNLERGSLGAFQFRTRLVPGVAYQVQASTDLHRWISIAGGQAREEIFDFEDAQAPRFSFRFYRIVAGGTVVSRNVVGYATVVLPPGFAMISNPFNAQSNAVAELFAGMPEGTTLSKFDTNLFRLVENSIRNGKWVNPRETLTPGEGAIIFNPLRDPKPLWFCGDVLQGSLNCPIATGFSIRSSMLPLPGRLYPNLGFPIASGDVIHLFDRERQKYTIFSYPSPEWDRTPPALTVGESFWVGKTAPSEWGRHYVSH